jgi:hypothetical protein
MASILAELVPALPSAFSLCCAGKAGDLDLGLAAEEDAHLGLPPPSNESTTVLTPTSWGRILPSHEHPSNESSSVSTPTSWGKQLRPLLLHCGSPCRCLLLYVALPLAAAIHH